MKKLGWLIVNAGQAIFLGVWTAFWISAALLVLAVTFRRDLPLIMARTCWAPGILWGAGAKVQVEGGEGIDWSRPHIFLMNHQSAIDIPVAFLVLKTPLRFIAKRILARVPFLGWYMWATGMIFVEREKSTKAVASLQHAGERIRAGASILAYPEGTRSRNSRILPFKKGTFVVAIEAQVPVVPVAISGADQVLSSTGFRVRPGTIRVKIGDPIPTAGLKRYHREALLKQVHDEVIDMHLAIGGPGGDRHAAVAARGKLGVPAPESEQLADETEPPVRQRSA
ncbi:lysophospholipid acyltransferase family protein [Vulgatibacter sp.]|uniref:lysophospholipid acyltransferase family protein n=1 Tax=Vulgatibacter sp. TaxID=1971226 RepID=UPI00356B37F2